MLVTVLSEWIRSIVSQCKATGISVYVKQLGTEEAKQIALVATIPKGEFSGVRSSHLQFEVKK
jgi:hypothetical protein